MAQQTALQFLIEELKGYEYDGNVFIFGGIISSELIEQAKQMEKEQIMKSFKSARIPYKYDADLRLNGFENAEQYYNETFGNK